MVFKQRFKYLKNEKINFFKVILKLEYLIFFYNYSIIFLFANKMTEKNTSGKIITLPGEFERTVVT